VICTADPNQVSQWPARASSMIAERELASNQEARLARQDRVEYEFAADPSTRSANLVVEYETNPGALDGVHRLGLVVDVPNNSEFRRVIPCLMDPNVRLYQSNFDSPSASWTRTTRAESKHQTFLLTDERAFEDFAA
jgi:hypothetical protein